MQLSNHLRRRPWMTPPGVNFTLSIEEMEKFAKAYNTYLVEAVRSLGGMACDVADAFPPTTQYFYDDCHYNENGSRTLAKVIRFCVMPKHAKIFPKLKTTREEPA